MMKTMNYYAIVVTALAIQFGGWQNYSPAQSEHSCPGGCEHEDAGEVIELIPFGNPSDFEDPRQSFYRMQGNPENYANSRSYERRPSLERPRNFSSEAKTYQGSFNRVESYQTNGPERGSYRRGGDRDMSYQTNYPESAQSREQRPPRDNWDNRGERYGAYRQGFADPESQLTGSEGHRHPGGCRGRCGSQGRGGNYDGMRGNRDYPQPDEYQFEQPRSQQSPNNEANQTPSLRLPISPAN